MQIDKRKGAVAVERVAMYVKVHPVTARKIRAAAVKSGMTLGKTIDQMVKEISTTQSEKRQ